VLVANLGTPDAPTTEAVRSFLAEFLSDRRVVDLPPFLWLPLLHGIILRIRPQKSARAYREIWTASGSPLLVNTRALARALEQRLPSMPVATGMTYGNPSIATALEALRASGAQKLLVLPLYPQYSATTTASVLDRVEVALRRIDWRPAILFVDDYYDDEAYIAALAESLAHVKQRKQFGTPLAQFQLVQQKLARMATDLTAARLLTYRAAYEKDQGQERITSEAAMAKSFATEMAQRVVDDAVQLIGGRGVLADHPVDRLYRAVRALRIYEGTTEIQQLIIAGELLR